ncbi:5'-nucleotidase C-terminal domain-containing protein [Christensenellaceae bacterium OttesenSCG-928-K19]|nr:5'-nucleotidase C-terminal domain-containing protein [Christensenellaceae bacterium OttesenSCG-928-K19]
MKLKLRLTTFVLLVVFFCIQMPVFAAGLPWQNSDLSGNTVIIHTNDSHGHVDDNMGFAAISALKQEYEDAGAAVLLLDAGDTFHGMPTATLTEGRDIVPLLNELGYAATTPGNHDFNYGYKHLAELADMLDFPIISANILLNGELMFEPNIIIEKNGVRFGVFGLTTPDTDFQTSPQHMEGVSFDAPAKAATEQVDLLQEQGVDYIIALTHIGVDHTSEYTTDRLAAEVKGIDIIIDGHSHTQMQDGLAVDSYTTLEPHGDTLIASTGAHIENIGVITFPAEGKITAKLYNEEDFPDQDSTVIDLVDEIKSRQSPELQAVIGYTPVNLNGEREDVRTSETNLGDLSADSLLDATGADLSFMNGGNIRATIAQGDITREDIITVFPFGNFILTKEVTGKTIIDALELSVSGYPGEFGGFLQVAGISFQFDPNQPKGSRIFDVQINGDEINPDDSYVLATNDYLAAGGDGYTMLADAPEISYYSSLEEVFTSYLQKIAEFPASTQGRITMGANASNSTEEQTDAADTEATIADAGTYTVQKGDSLWAIAKSQLGDAYRWPEIYQLNKEQIADPDLIDIGWQLELPAA